LLLPSSGIKLSQVHVNLGNRPVMAVHEPGNTNSRHKIDKHVIRQGAKAQRKLGQRL
jgi:hypothetical protein